MAGRTVCLKQAAGTKEDSNVCCLVDVIQIKEQCCVDEYSYLPNLPGRP